MASLLWIKAEWFQALQTLSIVGGLLFTAYTVRIDGKSRKVENLLSITVSHREIWSTLYDRPELVRILSPSADLVLNPITPDEQMFVHLVLLHLSAAYQAIKVKLFDKPHALEEDIGMFLSLPIPGCIWQRMKVFYEPDFIEFVENSRQSDSAPITKEVRNAEARS